MSRHSEASKGASGSCGYAKRAAMFGLDARIALAIFGALSVISGAALYNSIQDAKAVAVLAELKELGKTWEEYYLNKGDSFVPFNDDSLNTWHHVFKAEELASYTPYFWDETHDGGHTLFCNILFNCRAYIMRYNEIWPTQSWTDNLCKTGNECSIWARIYVGTENMDETLANNIDEIVDNGDGPLLGKFRWDDGYNYKITHTRNPYD